MADLIFYGFPASTYVRTALLTAEEKGVAYKLEQRDLAAEAFRAHQPFNKIPAMQHGDFALYETGAIARYIDAAFPGPALQPADIKARARMDQWVSVASDYLYQVMIREIVIQRVLVPMRGGKTDEAMVAAAVPKATYQMGVLENTLKQSPYFAGGAPSLADYFVLPIYNYLRAMPEGPTVTKGCAAAEDWHARMSARASAKKVLAMR
ncbi:MAG: glutathione S-transferase family protein [Alphaproteobacteria bacterium]